MGTVYCGPYAGKINAYAHEGHVAHILADGTQHTGHWLRDCTAYRAACACGWQSQRDYATTETGENHADDEWRSEHLHLLIDAEARKRTIRADTLLELTRSLRVATTETVTADGTPVFTEHSRGLLDAAGEIEALLDDHA